MTNEIKIFRDKNTIILQFSGEIRYTDTGGLEVLAEKLESEDLKDVKIIIDVNGVESIDSTNLGLIARIGSQYIEKYSKKINIVAGNKDIKKILDSMGFEQIADITDFIKFGKKDFNVLKFKDNGKNIAETVLMAHESLLRMDGEKNKIFKNVVDFLKKDIEKNDK